MEPRIKAAREAVTTARAMFEHVKEVKNRPEYDVRFAGVMNALEHFNHLRSMEMTRLGLDIM